MTDHTFKNASVLFQPTSSVAPCDGATEHARAAYQKPELICYGDVRDVTLGPTVGFGESGGGPFCAEGVNCP